MSDPIEAAMEEVLRPGRYISEHASFSLVNKLESVAARIAGADPEHAVGLYETFIAACYEVDDSSGHFGTFGVSLFSRWVTARPAGSVPRPGCRVPKPLAASGLQLPEADGGLTGREAGPQAHARHTTGTPQVHVRPAYVTAAPRRGWAGDAHPKAGHRG